MFVLQYNYLLFAKNAARESSIKMYRMHHHYFRKLIEILIGFYIFTNEKEDSSNVRALSNAFSYCDVVIR